MLTRHYRLPRLRRFAALSLSLFCFLLLSTRLDFPQFALRPFIPSVRSTNATLGFGRIYAVSKNGSPRRSRLIRASNVTELHITIPAQPEWTEDELDKFRLREGSKIAKGTMLAWLGHLHALRQFLDSGDETALLLEDDVDWDIRLRSVQVPLLASALSRLFPNSVSEMYPYGDPKDWDLLYLGHCGDYWGVVSEGFNGSNFKPEHLAGIPHVAFTDTTLPSMNNLHPWTAGQLLHLGVAPSTRLVHQSKFPLCTFAYAVTRASALRLLSDMAGRERKDGPSAYDIAILEACRDRNMRCWSVNPELFHHVQGRSVIGDIDRGKDTDYVKFMPLVDVVGRAQAEQRGQTSNIACGFWSGALDFEEGDLDRLAWLRTEFGRKGKCNEQLRTAAKPR